MKIIGNDELKLFWNTNKTDFKLKSKVKLNIDQIKMGEKCT